MKWGNECWTKPDHGVADRAVQPRHVECSVVGMPMHDRRAMAVKRPRKKNDAQKNDAQKK
jgi:hypothetical protein